MERGRKKGIKRSAQPDTKDSSVKKQQICIIHHDHSSNDSFICLSELKNSAERLRFLHDVRNKRLNEPISSKGRMQASCELIPDHIEDNHGYHRDCYQRFTKNLDRLKSSKEIGSTQDERCNRRRESLENVLFDKDCIFCNKQGPIGIKKAGSWTTEFTTKFKSDRWTTVLGIAENRSDEKLLRRIRGFDLFAAEAHFHPACRKSYEQNPEHWRSQDQLKKEAQLELEAAHSLAYTAVCNIVSNDIINNQKIIKLQDICETYIAVLKSTEFPNPNYRGEKLKSKLENTFNDKLRFTNLGLKGKFTSYLVYSSEISVESAVRNAFILGNNDRIADVAVDLRESILDTYLESKDLVWPLTSASLEAVQDVLPKDLSNFLKLLLRGRFGDITDRTERLVSSIGQDICRAVTNGEWKMPKHVAICMALRHLYRSKQLTTLMNRFGHCESHSFSIELETAISNAVDQSSNLLTSQIVRHPSVPSVFHSEFDNFDQLVNSPTGSGSIHTSHGIMMQEIAEDESHGGTVIPPLTLERDRTRSRQDRTDSQLPDCFIRKRSGPNLPIVNLSYPGCEGSFSRVTTDNFLWIFLRWENSGDAQQIPGWAGFISSIGKKPQVLTKLDYYPVINHPITEYKSVKECLRYAEEATHEVGQEYTVTTFDLGVCMKAYPLIWNDPVKYERHVIMIGTFHLICGYMRMVAKKMSGSGLSDILLEAGLIGSGSLQGVISGKHYNRAMLCHKVLLEALERLLLEDFMRSQNRDKLAEVISESAMIDCDTFKQAPTAKLHQDICKDESIASLKQKYSKFRLDVESGSHGKTASFWIQYMNKVWLIHALLQAVKTNDFLLYAECLSLMADLFFSFDGQNYARYLTYFSLFIANIDKSHPGAADLLKRGAISVARSFIPGNRCQVDKTMKETFMRHAKSRGGAGVGIHGITGNHQAYQRWVRTTHERSKFVEATLNMVDMAKDDFASSTHKDQRPSEVRKSEERVQNAMDAIRGYMNPFNIAEHDKLYCISSGCRIPTENEDDIISAETKGKICKDTFIDDRLKSDRKDFFDPVKKLKLKTMEDSTKGIKIKASKTKTIEYKQLGNIAFQLLVKVQDPDNHLDMQQILQYPLTPVPLSLGTADGGLAKTDKSKAVKHMLKDVEDIPDASLGSVGLVIIDGNALFHCLRDIPPSFKQISNKIFHMMPRDVDVVFSTDSYSDHSIKAMERRRRGSGEKILLQGENTKRPRDWSSFLLHDDNKKQLVHILLKSWSNNSYACHLQHRKVLLICDGKCYQLTSDDGETTNITELRDLESNQEETDTRVILYCLYAKRSQYKSVLIKSPDTDIFFILLHHLHCLEGLIVYLETGARQGKRLIDMTAFSKAYSKEYLEALLGIHAFTGCDTSSAFKGRGKIKALKLLESEARYVTMFSRLGNKWDLSSELISEIERFTCHLYGRSRTSSVNEMRYVIMTDKCEDKPLSSSRSMDLANLPPCRSCLIQHLKRVNYQVSVWKKAVQAKPALPDINNHGWVTKDNSVEPLWTDGDILPREAVSVLESVIDAGSDTDDESEDSEEFQWEED